MLMIREVDEFEKCNLSDDFNDIQEYLQSS